VIEPIHLAAATYGCAELALARLRHSRRGGPSTSHDHGSLQMLWIVISASIGIGIGFACVSRLGRFELSETACWAAWTAFAASAALRAWSVAALGQFFTVDVAIRDDHQLVMCGPYRWLRHPSYTGVIGCVASLFVLLQNGVSLVFAIGGVTASLMQRISVEERALAAAFGDAWLAHCARTWRLVPFVW
jgi:protein-S-isoprenylcysteine O-methyltransferase